jgi:hypothetical protein
MLCFLPDSNARPNQQRRQQVADVFHATVFFAGQFHQRLRFDEKDKGVRSNAVRHAIC